MKYSIDTIVNMMNDNVANNIKCYTAETYEDYGAGLKWRTIIVEDVSREDRRYQALTPRQHKDIELGLFTLEQIEELINDANRLYGSK